MTLISHIVVKDIHLVIPVFHKSHGSVRINNVIAKKITGQHNQNLIQKDALTSD